MPDREIAAAVADGPLLEATEHQPRVRAALVAALNGGASHAYLFHGPEGAGKRPAARAFAAELLAAGAREAGQAEDEAVGARRRALLDPSPHPDLVWVAPDGLQHRVEDIRERVIRTASRRPFEGGRRVFVIEQAEALRDEAQNALLKTLEEPPPYAHLVLITQAPEQVLPTVRSRCQPVEFAALSAGIIEKQLAALPDLTGAFPAAIRAAARLAAGDPARAHRLAAPAGAALREAAERYVATALDDEGSAQPWQAILAAAEDAGGAAEAAAQARLDENAELGFKLSKTESGQAVRREARRARIEVLDLALDLVQAWLRDLAAVSAGAPDLVHNADRADELAEQAAALTSTAPHAGLVLVGDYRRRLEVNVSEELAFEALHAELRRVLRH